MHYIKLFVSISNQQCASSQFLWWILQPCFVLKSRPQKILKNFSSFPLSSRSSSIIVSRFGLLAVLFWPTSIICIAYAFSRFSSEILNVIPNALLRTIQSQSGFNNICEYFTDYVCKYNPNWPA